MHTFRPVLDGAFFPTDLFDRFKNGDFAKEFERRRLELLIGEVRDEVSRTSPSASAPLRWTDRSCDFCPYTGNYLPSNEPTGLSGDPTSSSLELLPVARNGQAHRRLPHAQGSPSVRTPRPRPEYRRMEEGVWGY